MKKVQVTINYSVQVDDEVFNQLDQRDDTGRRLTSTLDDLLFTIVGLERIGVGKPITRELLLELGYTEEDNTLLAVIGDRVIHWISREQDWNWNEIVTTNKG